jgi:hypothetical protein
MRNVERQARREHAEMLGSAVETKGTVRGRDLVLGASVAGLLALAASPALAEKCILFDAGTNAYEDAACTVTYGDSGETIVIGDKRLVFVQAGRQGQWAVGTLDGRPAMRYEVNRSTYSYATSDMKLFLDHASE